MDPGKFLLLPPPPHWIWNPENFYYYPPPTESIRAKLGLPPQMDVGPYAYGPVHLPHSISPEGFGSMLAFAQCLFVASISAHYRLWAIMAHGNQFFFTIHFLWHLACLFPPLYCCCYIAHRHASKWARLLFSTLSAMGYFNKHVILEQCRMSLCRPPFAGLVGCQWCSHRWSWHSGLTRRWGDGTSFSARHWHLFTAGWDLISHIDISETCVSAIKQSCRSAAAHCTWMRRTDAWLQTQLQPIDSFGCRNAHGSEMSIWLITVSFCRFKHNMRQCTPKLCTICYAGILMILWSNY